MWAASSVSSPSTKSVAATHPRAVRVAGFWRRSLAGACDGAILLATFVLLDCVVHLVLGEPLPRLSQFGPDYFLELAMKRDPLAQAGLWLLVAISLLYFFLFHALRGQTPGKRLCGLQLIDGFGEPPSLGRTLVRTLGGLVSFALLTLGFWWIAFDAEKRALHDHLADTYVIISSSRTSS